MHGGKSIGYDMWSNDSTLFISHLKRSGRVEAGTISDGDGTEPYHLGEHKESHLREYLWGTKHNVASEQHAFESIGSDMQTQSIYSGYEAQAQVEDDLAAGSDIGNTKGRPKKRRLREVLRVSR